MKEEKKEINFKDRIYADTIEIIDELYDQSQNIHSPEVYAHYFYDFMIQYLARMKAAFLSDLSRCNHPHSKSKKKKKSKK